MSRSICALVALSCVLLSSVCIVQASTSTSHTWKSGWKHPILEECKKFCDVHFLESGQDKLCKQACHRDHNTGKIVVETTSFVFFSSSKSYEACACKNKKFGGDKAVCWTVCGWWRNYAVNSEFVAAGRDIEPFTENSRKCGDAFKKVFKRDGTSGVTNPCKDKKGEMTFKKESGHCSVVGDDKRAAFGCGWNSAYQQLVDTSNQVKVDKNKFEECMASGKTAEECGGHKGPVVAEANIDMDGVKGFVRVTGIPGNPAMIEIDVRNLRGWASKFDVHMKQISAEAMAVPIVASGRDMPTKHPRCNSANTGGHYKGPGPYTDTGLEAGDLSTKQPVDQFEKKLGPIKGMTAFKATYRDIPDYVDVEDLLQRSVVFHFSLGGLKFGRWVCANFENGAKK